MTALKHEIRRTQGGSGGTEVEGGGLVGKGTLTSIVHSAPDKVMTFNLMLLSERFASHPRRGANPTFEEPIARR